jgi:DNA-binding transcriptional MocR family regulator
LPDRNPAYALLAARTKSEGEVSCRAAMKWAYGQQIKPSSRKNVFVNLCYHRNELTGETWPSISLIREETGLDRDTVIESLDDLISQKRIEDTGQRKGQTRSVKVYRVVGFPVSSRKNGTAKHAEFSTKQSEFSQKQSGFSPENKQNKQGNAVNLAWMKTPELKFLRAKIIEERNSGKLDSVGRTQTRQQLLQIKQILGARGFQYAASL